MRRRYGNLLVAAVLLATLTLINWVAALGLAFCCLMLMAVAVPTQKGFSAEWVLGAAGLAYLLACFWLTPTFIGTVLLNWPQDSFGYRAGIPQLLSAAGLAACAFLLWRVLVRAGRGFYFAFVNLATFLFAWITFGHYWFGISLIPESRRYAVEFEFFLVLAAIEWLRIVWARNRRVAAGIALVAVLPGLPQAWKYVTQNRAIRAPWPLEDTVEYPMARWLAQQKMDGRVFATGGLRFRLNAWFEVPQVGGGFESGLTNRRPVDLYYQVRTGSAGFGRGTHDQLTQLKALGVQYVAIHGAKSREHYKDFVNPGQFEGVLPVAFRLEDDIIYSLPSSGLAHLVRTEELAKWHKPPHLDAYAAALDDSARPKLAATWHGPNELAVEGPVPEGMLVSVQVNHDPGWAAYQNGRAVPIDKDLLGFLVLRPRPAPEAHIDLRYEGTLEQQLMAGISVLAWLAAMAGIWFARRYGRVEISQ